MKKRMLFTFMLSFIVIFSNVLAQHIPTTPALEDLALLEIEFDSELINKIEKALGIDRATRKKECRKKVVNLTFKKKLKRFDPVYTYNPSNASALNEMAFVVNVACSCHYKELPPPPGFDLSYPIIGFDPLQPEVKTLYAYIFVSSSKNMIALVFTATNSVSLWLNNLRFGQVFPANLKHVSEGMLVHRGFYEIYLSVQERIRKLVKKHYNNTTQFICAGYSLGGALTTLASFDLSKYNPIVYTFGSPRVGNTEFATGYNEQSALSNTWRIFNTEDVIPSLPTPEIPLGFKFPVHFLYTHVGNPVPFTINLGNLKKDQVDNGSIFFKNHVKAYEKIIIKQKAPLNPNGICPVRFCP